MEFIIFLWTSPLDICRIYLIKIPSGLMYSSRSSFLLSLPPSLWLLYCKQSCHALQISIAPSLSDFQYWTYSEPQCTLTSIITMWRRNMDRDHHYSSRACIHYSMPSKQRISMGTRLEIIICSMHQEFTTHWISKEQRERESLEKGRDSYTPYCYPGSCEAEIWNVTSDLQESVWGGGLSGQSIRKHQKESRKTSLLRSILDISITKSMLRKTMYVEHESDQKLWTSSIH